MPANDGPDWKTIAIGEIYVTANGVPLTAADFSDAQCVTSPCYSSDYAAKNALDGQHLSGYVASTGGSGSTHILEYTLAQPQNIDKIVVFNRTDCCQWRLAGAQVQLFDSSGNMLWSAPLTADMQQTFVR